MEWLESFRVVAKKKKKSALRGVIPPRASRGSRTAKTTAFRASFRRQQESFGTKRLWYKRMRNCIPHECTATDACIVLHPFVKKKQFFQATNGQLQENKVCYLLRKTVLKVQVKYINIHIYIVILDFFFDNEQLQQLGKLRECCFCWFLF